MKGSANRHGHMIKMALVGKTFQSSIPGTKRPMTMTRSICVFFRPVLNTMLPVGPTGVHYYENWINVMVSFVLAMKNFKF